jgi:hypothetical protein
MNSPTISRRHALGIFAGAAVLPAKALANYAPPRGEIRTDLAKLFADAGTAGTFVGYKVDDYLVISSDSDRSGEARLPASTFKIANSVIALETGVVGDPDKDVFKWDGVKHDNEAWNRITPCARRSRRRPFRSIRRSRAVSDQSGCRNTSIRSTTATAISAAVSTGSG